MHYVRFSERLTIIPASFMWSFLHIDILDYTFVCLYLCKNYQPMGIPYTELIAILDGSEKDIQFYGFTGSFKNLKLSWKIEFMDKFRSPWPSPTPHFEPYTLDSLFAILDAGVTPVASIHEFDAGDRLIQ